MKIIDPKVSDALRSKEYIQALLVKIVVGLTEFNITSWTDVIKYEDELYYPKGMKIGAISYSSSSIVSTVTVSIDDVDRSTYSLLADAGSDKFPINLRLAILNEYGVIEASVGVFNGIINKWEYTPGVFKITAASVFEQWAQVTTARFSGSCRWKVFGGVECKYSGSGFTCDRTYDQCSAYQNSDNFGGFRWLPSLVNKKISI